MLPSSWINDALVRVRRSNGDAEPETSGVAGNSNRKGKSQGDGSRIFRLVAFNREDPVEVEREDVPEERWTGSRSSQDLIVVEGPRFAG